jgi:hypothetical protein
LGHAPLCPDLNTPNSQSDGALWPRSFLSGEDALDDVADQLFHVGTDSCLGMAIIALLGSAFTWATNWPPVACASVLSVGLYPRFAAKQ